MTGVSLLLTSLLLVGCREDDRADVRFALATEPVTLDPRFATDAVSYRITRLIYRSLVDFDTAFRPVPSLARWERPEATRYRFFLNDRSGLAFHDGSPLTSADVKATYDLVLDPGTASPHRTSLANIERIETPDEGTVDFILHKPDPLFPGRLVVGIMPARLLAAGHPFNDRPIGSGPFAFVAWPQPGDLRLTRLRDLQAVRFLAVKDPTVRVLKLLRHEIDLFQGDLPQEMLAWLEERPAIRVRRGAGNTFTYLGFNLRDPVVGRLAVRQAIGHAIDREAIIRYVMKGTARPAGAMLPPDHWAGAPQLQGLGHDIERARRLLEAAGFTPAHPARIVYKTSNNPFRVRLATIIQHQLKQAGFEVEVRSYDWGTFYSDIRTGRFQMYSLSWVGLKMPDIFHYAFHSSAVPPSGANRGRFASDEADRLIEAAESADDPAEQARLYRALQTHLLEQLPYVPLWYEDQVLVMDQALRGYDLAADGNYDGLIHIERIANGARVAAH